MAAGFVLRSRINYTLETAVFTINLAKQGAKAPPTDFLYRLIISPLYRSIDEEFEGEFEEVSAEHIFDRRALTIREESRLAERYPRHTASLAAANDEETITGDFRSACKDGWAWSCSRLAALQALEKVAAERRRCSLA